LLVKEFLEFKAFDLFSLSFGIGIAVQAERAAARGVSVPPFLLRRFLILLAFGAIHITLVSNVDILVLYAVCALILIPFLRLPLALLAVIGIGAFSLPAIYQIGLPPESILQIHGARATRIYGEGSFFGMVPFRWNETRLLIAPLLVMSAQKTFGLMLAGVALWRSGIVREPRPYRYALWAVCLAAGVIGLITNMHIPLAFAYAAALLAWQRSNRSTAFTAPVAAAGRMALTNYLAQSIIFAILFYGYGFGLFGKLDTSRATVIGITVYALQLWFSAWWLRRYRFGPFEWIWRSMTYGRRLPNREPRIVRMLLIVSIAALTMSSVLDPNRPEVHQNILDHFKYGSIGAEERTGVPYPIWLALPRMFPQYLPNKPGNGYERFGFIYEPGKQRPIGTSLRQHQVLFVGLNCAACHTGTLRETSGGSRQIVLGMPAHQIDLQGYQRFLFQAIRDPHFTPDNVWAAIRTDNPQVSWLEGIIYRWFVIPRTKDVAARLEKEASWTEARPLVGPGRVDTFNPYKVVFGFDMALDKSVGSADLPSLWNQKVRDGMWLHWDGNNNLVAERNKSAAIGAGCSESSLDLDAMKRVEDWIWTLPAPTIPAVQIDHARSQSGAKIFKTQCAKCHEPGSPGVGQVTALSEVGTDPERLNSFTAALTDKMNTLGSGRPWKFSHFRKTNGYAAMPLDGIWLRAPYLHNGSVPTLRDLLEKPDRRPATFWRVYDVYDYKNAGFVSSGREAEAIGFRYDTTVTGNGNRGHLYGTDLNAKDKDDLLEYLKTL
jgi:uncharacterized membrane protein YeiB/mono/diheme cytochrome c family protein